jgi:hypothetical protein
MFREAQKERRKRKERSIERVFKKERGPREILKK